MKADSNQVAAGIAIAMGIIAFWSNPKRQINRLFLGLSLHAAMWILFAGAAGNSTPTRGQLLLRISSAVGAFFPLHFWVIKEAIVTPNCAFSWIRSRCLPWLGACMVLALTCFTEVFMRSASSREQPGFGWGFYFYIAGCLLCYLLLAAQTYRQMRSVSGGARIELQIVLLGGTASAVLVVLLMAGRSFVTPAWVNGIRSLVILTFYVATVVAMTTSRIFDARHLVFFGIQKFALLISVAAPAYGVNLIVSPLIPNGASVILLVVVTLLSASLVGAWLNKRFQLYPQANSARQAAFAVSRRESRLENLEGAFISILKGWGKTDHALLAIGAKEGLRSPDVEIAGDSPILRTMRHVRWVTPERLAREKPTKDRVLLGEFLDAHHLGLLIIGEGPSLTLLIGVGVSASRRPFTFPQVTQLMELSSIMESAIERAYFSVKAQHAEQLATVGLLGASLAHEIRNPLVSIKTFVQLLPTHHQDPAFRTKFFSLISEEVLRIDRLSEQLLDLASPKAYLPQTLELHPVLRDSLDLVATKAAGKRIEFLLDFSAAPDLVVIDPSAARQVFINLCFNAIQAVEAFSGAGWVRISTQNIDSQVEMVVSDSGPGIAPEIRSKLFQPFHSTKSSGFGLGLAICIDILTSLNASISVDPFVPGTGAVFRVRFPCPASSSS